MDFCNNGESSDRRGKDGFIGGRKWPIKAATIRPGTLPQEALIKTQLGLSVETESTLSAAQLARLYGFSLISNGKQVVHDFKRLKGTGGTREGKVQKPVISFWL